MPNSIPRISFCTTIKNRLHHLKQTLPQNMMDNESCANIEFLIMDYNSSDGLEQWIKEEMQKAINSSRLTYYKTTFPKFYDRSHSRNLAFNLATGDIICNLDADNFTGPLFADYIRHVFEVGEDQYITTFSDTYKPNADIVGRICCLKKHFMQVGGYDEGMQEYGFEDFDFANKLSSLGLRRTVLTEKQFLGALFHDDELRISEEKTFKNLLHLYIRHKNYYKTDLLFLFRDNTFHRGMLVETRGQHSTNVRYGINPRKNEYAFTLDSPCWLEGKWEFEGDHLLLTSAHSKDKLQSFKMQDGGMLKIGRKMYRHVTSKDLIINVVMFHAQFANRNKMKNNLVNGHIKIAEFGRGSIYRNFSSVEIKI
jgi:glycosyltransferase involved in cell wall biosynthesis